MNQFQKLDDLIIEHTLPPAQIILRNQLALTREQIEAYQNASDEQDATLERQAKAIAELQEEKEKLLERQSRALDSPFRVSDDYEFNTEGGFWTDRKTGLRVCARCLVPPTKIVSPLFEALGLGSDGEEMMVWRCGQCGSSYC